VELTPERVAELVAGYVLDALDEPETAMVAALAARDALVAEAVAAGHHTVAALASVAAGAPPARIRSRTLATAWTSRPPSRPPAT
jgi:anti-sigma-K factor RskA